MTIKPFIALPSFLLMVLLASATCLGMEHELWQSTADAAKVNKQIKILLNLYNAQKVSKAFVVEAKKVRQTLLDKKINIPAWNNLVDYLINHAEHALDPNVKLNPKYQFTPEQSRFQQQIEKITYDFSSENDVKKLESSKKKFELLLSQAKQAKYETEIDSINSYLSVIGDRILCLTQTHRDQRNIKLLGKLKTRNKQKVIEKLLTSEKKDTILQDAKLGNIVVLRRALESEIPERRKAALETVDQDGNNALHTAAQAGKKNTVAFLLTCPFDPLALNNAGKTARILAKENDHGETVAILAEAENKTRASKKIADNVKAEVKHEVEQDESKQNSKNKRKAKRAAAQAKKDQVAFEVEVTQKKEKEQREEEVQEKERAAQEKHENELRAYFQKAVAEDDDENWTKMLLPIRIPTQCIIRNGIRYMPHASERMAPDTPKVRAKLEKRALAKGLQRNTEAFEKYIQPRGISFEEVEQAISHPDHTSSHGGAHIYRRGRLKLVTKMLEAMVTVITAVWEQ